MIFTHKIANAHVQANQSRIFFTSLKKTGKTGTLSNPTLEDVCMPTRLWHRNLKTRSLKVKTKCNGMSAPTFYHKLNFPTQIFDGTVFNICIVLELLQ
jgi:hypothetical protein